MVEIEDAVPEVIVEWFHLWRCLEGTDCTDWAGGGVTDQFQANSMSSAIS